MSSSLARTRWLMLALCALGCAPKASQNEPEAPREKAAAKAPERSGTSQAAPSPEATAAEAAEPSSDAARSPAHEPAEPAAPQPGTPLDARPADPSRALPEVRVRHIGMHIGGGPNDPESKKPFLQAIEAHNQKYLLCYRLVRSPLGGGTFGVDLFVGSAGGTPEVRATRQRLGSDDFESCMVDAFHGLRFARPTKPTTFSYSLRFDVADGGAGR